MAGYFIHLISGSRMVESDVSAMVIVDLIPYFYVFPVPRKSG